MRAVPRLRPRRAVVVHEATSFSSTYHLTPVTPTASARWPQRIRSRRRARPGVGDPKPAGGRVHGERTRGSCFGSTFPLSPLHARRRHAGRRPLTGQVRGELQGENALHRPGTRTSSPASLALKAKSGVESVVARPGIDPGLGRGRRRRAVPHGDPSAGGGHDLVGRRPRRTDELQRVVDAVAGLRRHVLRSCASSPRRLAVECARSHRLPARRSPAGRRRPTAGRRGF